MGVGVCVKYREAIWEGNTVLFFLEESFSNDMAESLTTLYRPSDLYLTNRGFIYNDEP